ncbi:MAG: hypothetical protein K2H20_01275 [Bacilli bacterium]|nr:hypothetical protein [Bacilli bacterium]
MYKSQVIYSYDRDEANRLDYGVRQMEFTEDGIYLQNKFFIDYDLKEVTQTENEDKYIFSEDTTISDGYMVPYFGLKSVCEVESYSSLWSCDRNGDYTISSKGWDSGTASLNLYKKGEKIWSILNKDYNIFMYTKLYNDMIITVAGKYDDNILNYKSDILFYDLEGNMIGKIEENELLSYLTVSEERFAFGREVIDGICGEDKYNRSDSGCDSITTFDIYTLGTSAMNPPEDEGAVSGVTITNPETSSHKVIYLIIVLFGSLSIGLMLRKKLKIN